MRVILPPSETKSPGGDGPPLKVSETIVRNVRVLATDQRFTDKDEDGKTAVKTFSNVTMEVTPKIAEKISVAQSVGTLSLSLRSIADNAAELERAVAAGQVKLPAGASPAQEKAMLLQVANRPMDGGSTYTTGGEVSRFQRTSVPSRKSEAAPVASNGGSSGGSASSGYTGPAVRVSRGNNVTVVPVGAR